MFIAIVGTPSAGKKTVQRYLVEKHGFTVVGLERPSDPMAAAKLSGITLDVPLARLSVSETPVQTPLETPPLPPTPTSPSTSTSTRSTFPSTGALLDYTTKSWLTNHVTCDLKTYEEVEPFLKRPWFLLVSVDGPLRTRYERVSARTSSSVASTTALTLDEFVDAHDLLLNGPLPAVSVSATAAPAQQLGYQPQTDFSRVQGVAQVKVLNNFASTQGLWAYLDQLDLCNEERLRPGWDTYFMTLASLASHRSNCMKRRVGALLVRSKRILSTGYNGTPRGTRNCNHGGCRRCNGSARGGEALDECLCLHAEENALLEAGRDRTGDDSVLYCNTCPCLRCSVKIVQCGVREVVYNQSYSMDEASAMVLKEGGVVLRQLHLPPGVGL